MQTLQEKVASDWVTAMKARDPKKDVLSLIKTELKNKAINTRSDGPQGTSIADDEAIVVLQKMAKQRKESIESYKAGGRADLEAKEAFELSVIEAYLPAALSDDELRNMIHQVMKESGASSMKDIGKVMGPLAKLTKGRADGKRLQELVREQLQGA